ncbi:MAG: peptidylprolyl isomerase [Acidimicrobiales bacterium]|nr:peptidylprolyl isomerase [Acidimicrobiales bacterium]
MKQISPLLRRAFVAAAFVLVVSACGSDSDDALITVNGVEMMSVDELGSTFDRSLVGPALEYGITTEVLVAELSDRGYEASDEVRADAQTEFDLLAAQDPTFPAADSAEAMFVLRRFVALYAVADHLAAEGVEPSLPAELCSSHILVDTLEEAEAVVVRLDAGEDFAAVAMEVSIGPSSEVGGDIGCYTTDSLDPGYVAGARATDIGDVSAPAQSSFGWHVIHVRSFEAQSIDDPIAVRDAYLSTPEFAELEAAAFTDVEIEIHPDFGTYDPVTGVTPAG